MKFLKGLFLTLSTVGYNNFTCREGTPETLIAIDEIKRIRACKYIIYSKKDGSVVSDDNVGLVVTCPNRFRIVRNDEQTQCYVLSDPVEVIAKALGRSEDELSAMLIEAGFKEK